MRERVVILGAGGHARETLDVLLACSEESDIYEFLGFIDENPATHGQIVNGYPVLGGFEAIPPGEVKAICAIGNPAVKRKVVGKARDLGLKFFSLVHPTVVKTLRVDIGEGVLLAAGCILTNNIRIGDHAILNVGVTVAHDCVIGEYCTVAPGVHIAGNVRVGEGCDLGIGASVIQGVSIGDWTIVGAGAVVIDDLPPNVTAVGIPASVIKSREPGWHDAV